MFRIKYKLRISFGFLLLLSSFFNVVSQDKPVKPWDINPKGYLRELAGQTSLDQKQIQDSLKLEKDKQAKLEVKLQKTNDSDLASRLRSDFRLCKLKVRELQSELTEKIKLGKEYKEWLALSDQEIRQRLNASTVSLPAATNKTDTISKPEQQLNSTQSPSPISTVVEPNQGLRVDPSLLKSDSKSHEPWSQPESTHLLIKEDCQFQESTKDINRKTGSSLLPEVLFRYTPDELKKYMHGQSYLTATAFMGTEPGFTYLQLRLDIASDQALRHYGNLEKSVLVIHFVNGKEAKLINSRFDPGFSDNSKKTTTMTGVYYMDKPVIKMLSSSEVDSIRLNFLNGYEDYTVYNVDFFTRQLACINAPK